MAEAAFQIGWWENVVVHAQEGLQISNTIARLHYLLGKALIGLENYVLARESLIKCRNLENTDAKHELDCDIDLVQKKIHQE